ncbi:hypothetical protein DFH29DRAFT_1075679, partial [Suillus ampliporus]
MATLPAEILQYIFTFLSVQDIIRVRRVCRYFQKASQDRHVWSTVYKNSRLPRLPGPFPGQTALYLENSLTQSAKLQRNWTSSTQVVAKPLYTRSRQWPYALRARLEFRTTTFLMGPWLIVAVRDKIVCYDVDSGNDDASVLYNAQSQFGISTVDFAQAPYSGGQHSACLAVQEYVDHPRIWDAKQNLKIFHLSFPDHQLPNVPILELLLEQDVPPGLHFIVAVGPRCFVAAPREHPDTHAHVYVIDTKCRRRLYIPSVSASKHIVNQPSNTSVHRHRLLACSSHVLVMRAIPVDTGYWSSFINAYQLPSDEDMDQGVFTLQITHSGVFPRIGLVDVACLRESVADGMTGSKLLTLLAYTQAQPYNTQSGAIDVVRLELTFDGHLLIPECRRLLAD